MKELLALWWGEELKYQHPLSEALRSLEGEEILHSLRSIIVEGLRNLRTTELTEQQALWRFRLHFPVQFAGEYELSFTMQKVVGNTTLFFIWADLPEQLKQIHSLMKQKDVLAASALQILDTVSKNIINESSAKISAQRILQKISELLGARAAIMRLFTHGRWNHYASYGLNSPYLGEHHEIYVEHIPFYKRLIREQRLQISDNPREDLGVLTSDLERVVSPLCMVVSVPLIKNKTVRGFISLAFDEPKPVLYFMTDVLENFANEFAFILEKNEYYLYIVETSERFKKMNIDIVTSLVNATETRDSYTTGHSIRVASYAVELARHLHWDDYELEKLNVASLLHDIGKVGIPDAILLKPLPLNDMEYSIMKLHPDFSANIVAKVENLQEIVPWIRFHHEYMDGSGYPYGLKGKDIPLGARVIAVADAFDAMTSDRPYRKALPLDQVEDIFKEGSGKQWDEEIVALAIRYLDVIYERSTMVKESQLEDFRQMMFRLNLLNGLYLFEYLHEEVETLIANNIPFVFGFLKFPEKLHSFPHSSKKKMVHTLTEMIKKELHYPILVGRKSYLQFVFLASQYDKQLLQAQLKTLVYRIYDRVDMMIDVAVYEYPQEKYLVPEVFDNFTYLRENSN
ncbi:HD domain-containing phosphohydrolase [Thermospira aquatica]|uniref:HD domain-containing protein n=1 Tax=Thermospira aquatica TaxID=2828656 RepID=A0AAX3BBJ2_9SPIR|nr:HD domain-containing phosphohydrolase [Thermospira aquatica]URA09651.1 HD domain-containing protein [Thermospira aquatica]